MSIQGDLKLIEAAKRQAAVTGKIQYIYGVPGSYYTSASRSARWVARIYPGGRVELRGSLAEEVKEWRKS